MNTSKTIKNILLNTTVTAVTAVTISTLTGCGGGDSRVIGDSTNHSYNLNYTRSF